MHNVPGSSSSSSGETARGPATNTSRRRASITGTRPAAHEREHRASTPPRRGSRAPAPARARREPDTRAREASRPGADDERVEIRRLDLRLCEQRVDVLEQRACRADALAEHLAVADEGARRDVGRRVEREDEHQEMPCSSAVSAEASVTTRRSPPPCSSRPRRVPAEARRPLPPATRRRRPRRRSTARGLPTRPPTRRRSGRGRGATRRRRPSSDGRS